MDGSSAKSRDRDWVRLLILFGQKKANFTQISSLDNPLLKRSRFNHNACKSCQNSQAQCFLWRLWKKKIRPRFLSTVEIDGIFSIEIGDTYSLIG